MADWARASEILSAAPKFSPGDASVQQSTRLWQALDARLRASSALSARARDAQVAAAEASVAELGVEEKRAAVDEVVRHFSTLTGGERAIADAMRPTPAGSVFWADPALHAQIDAFLRAVNPVSSAVAEDAGAVDWAARFAPEKSVIDANVADAASAYESLKESFEKMVRAREEMIALEKESEK